MSKLLIGARVLMYHSIAANPRDPHALPPAAFSGQLAAIARSGWQVVGLADLLTALQQRRRVGGLLVLTFDDAYQDFLIQAEPLLARYHFPATLFIPTGFIGQQANWDTHDPAKKLLDWSELEQLDRSGRVTFGSHTVTHPRLTTLAEETVREELTISLETLRARLTHTLPVLAYPGGYHGPREWAIARELGYHGGVGVSHRLPVFRWSNPYHLPRCRWTQLTRPFPF